MPSAIRKFLGGAPQFIAWGGRERRVCVHVRVCVCMFGWLLTAFKFVCRGGSPFGPHRNATDILRVISVVFPNAHQYAGNGAGEQANRACAGGGRGAVKQPFCISCVHREPKNGIGSDPSSVSQRIPSSQTSLKHDLKQKQNLSINLNLDPGSIPDPGPQIN